MECCEVPLPYRFVTNAKRSAVQLALVLETFFTLYFREERIKRPQRGDTIVGCGND